MTHYDDLGAGLGLLSLHDGVNGCNLQFAGQTGHFGPESDGDAMDIDDDNQNNHHHQTPGENGRHDHQNKDNLAGSGTAGTHHGDALANDPELDSDHLDSDHNSLLVSILSPTNLGAHYALKSHKLLMPAPSRRGSVDYEFDTAAATTSALRRFPNRSTFEPVAATSVFSDTEPVVAPEEPVPAYENSMNRSFQYRRQMAPATYSVVHHHHYYGSGPNQSHGSNFQSQYLHEENRQNRQNRQSGESGENGVGYGNFGYGNVGSGNVGYGNVGSGNLGSRNNGAGDYGSGNYGSDNFGSRNYGAGNFGHGNSGSGNYGSSNSGSGNFVGTLGHGYATITNGGGSVSNIPAAHGETGEFGKTSPSTALILPSPWDTRSAPAEKTPYLLSSYLQLATNIALSVYVGHLIVTIVRTIKQDVAYKLDMHANNILVEIALCERSYLENNCHPDTIVPALEKMCGYWEKCMNQDPFRGGNKSLVSAQTIAMIINLLVEPLSFKVLLVFAVAATLVFAGNFAFGYVRAKTYYGWAQRSEVVG